MVTTRRLCTVRRAWVAGAALALLVTGCGDAGTASTAPTLTTVPVTTVPAPTVPAATTIPQDLQDLADAIEESLVPPPEEIYLGRHRVVHLFSEPDGTTPIVDIWARRSFEYLPVLLIEGLEYGDATEYFGSPETMALAVVRAGDGPDGDELSGLFSAGEGEQHSSILAPDGGGAAAWLFEERYAAAPDRSVEPPDPGQGILLISAIALLDAREAGTLPGGGAWYVGESSTDGCLPQVRLEAEGFSPAILGGTQVTEHVLAPGSYSLTFHEWPGDGACEGPTMLPPIGVQIGDGSMQWLLLHSTDGVAVESLLLPIE